MKKIRYMCSHGVSTTPHAFFLIKFLGVFDAAVITAPGSE